MTAITSHPAKTLEAAAPEQPHNGNGHRRFTCREYQRMGEAGILTDADRVELLDGEVVMMSPIGVAHGTVVARLNRFYLPRLENRGICWVQGTLAILPSSEPLPDIQLLKFREDVYGSTHPTPSDVLLLIEVADTTLEKDRKIKLPIYARAGIQEYWIADLARRVMIVCREPMGDDYRKIEQFERSAKLAPQAFPDLGLPLEKLFNY